MRTPKSVISDSIKPARPGTTLAQGLCLSLVVAGLFFTGCAVAPPAAQTVTTSTGSGHKSVEHFGGIGLQVAMKDGLLTIVSILQNSPASRSKLRPGDVIVEISGESTQGMTLVDAVNKMRGKVGTTVRIKSIRPPNQVVTLHILHRRIITDAVTQPPSGQDSPAALPSTPSLPVEGTTPF
jgi:membrane-associated protease RseP (regulator of RpoE activity)